MNGGVRFAEQMSGRLARPGAPADTTRATMRGTVAIVDLQAFFQDSNHTGLLTGAVRIDALGADWMAAQGHVRLFSMGRVVGERLMEYRMAFERGAQRYTLAGTKYVFDHAGFDVWADVTTLHTTLIRHDADGREINEWIGVLRLSLGQAARLMLTLSGTGSRGWLSRLGLIARFGLFFLCEVAARFLPRRSGRAPPPPP